MSIATLKRKTNASYRTLSGKSPSDRFVINKGSGGNPSFTVTANGMLSNARSVSTSTGGGFSINGKRRNIGRVGQHMLMSRGLSHTKNVPRGKIDGKYVNVPTWKGGGGKNGTYGGESFTPAGFYGLSGCFDNSNTVKPSVLSHKGMMKYKNRWTKMSVSNDVIAQIAGYNGVNGNADKDGAFPRSDTIKMVCNNWVQDASNTQAQHILDNIKPAAQRCNPDKYSDVPLGPYTENVYNCKVCTKPGRCCSHHIGGKYYPPTPFSKQTTFVPDASVYTSNVKRDRGQIGNDGWVAHWPDSKSTFQCMTDVTSVLDTIEEKSKYSISAADGYGTSGSYLKFCNKKNDDNFVDNYKRVLNARSNKKNYVNLGARMC